MGATSLYLQILLTVHNTDTLVIAVTKGLVLVEKNCQKRAESTSVSKKKLMERNSRSLDGKWEACCLKIYVTVNSFLSYRVAHGKKAVFFLFGSGQLFTFRRGSKHFKLKEYTKV